MTSDKPEGNGQAVTPADEQTPNVRIAAQFIRDLSFESPNVQKLLSGPGEDPNLQLQVNVGAKSLDKNLYESVIEFSAHAISKEGTIYELEITYGGIFQVENLPADAIEPFLLVNCPALLFPFLRRIVADITREGGFPPLFLDPIDFAGLYVNRNEQDATGIA